MNLQQTIETLAEHNKWRRGDDPTMIDPVTIGMAIDSAIDHLGTIETLKAIIREQKRLMRKDDEKIPPLTP